MNTELITTEITKKKKINKKATVVEQEPDKIYGLYLAIKPYKYLLNENEYLINDNGDVLLGLYKDMNLAIQHKEKFSKRGILINLITELI